MKKTSLFIMIVFLVSMIMGCTEKISQSKQSNTESALQQKMEEEQRIEKTESQLKEEYLNKLLASLTMEEKVGQLFMVAYRQNIEGSKVVVVNDKIRSEIKQYGFGGVILFGENIDTAEQTKKLIADYQSVSRIPLFMAVDEEGGRVSRLHSSGKIEAETIPSAAVMAQQGNAENVYHYYTVIAQQLKGLGFNMDFAPVADVNTNPQNVVIGDRAFGSDPIAAAEFVGTAVKALQENGIISTVKHFPGHGDTTTDTHKEQTISMHTIERLEEIEFIPFQKAILNGVDCIMTAHIVTPNVTEDTIPASLSKFMIEDILRKKLGFEGVVVTDALDMGAITQYYTSQEAAIAAIHAGVDLILMPENVEEAYEGVLNAVNEGTISQERIEESVKRILTLKLNRGILNKK